LSGNGTQQTRSGIDGMTTSGTTGAHPREDSPHPDGLGCRDTGITTAGSSNTLEKTGTDSRATSGSDMDLPSRSIQLHPEVKRSADLSECLRSLDSQDHSVLRDFQDARSEQERAQSSTCGKIERHADSLEEDSQCRSAASVRLAGHISGLESSDVLEVQSSPRRD